MARTLITTLTPNSDVATYTLTGSGSGEKQYIAEITYPNEEPIETNTIDVTDCVFLDGGTDGTQTNYYNTSNNVTVTYDDTGKTFANNTSSSRSIYPVKVGVTPSSTNLYCFDCDFAIELDLIEYTSVSSLQVGDGTNNFYKRWDLYGCSGGEHIKYEIKSDTQKVFVDGVNVYTETYNFSTPLYVRFSQNAGRYQKIKNLMSYPI